MYVCMCVCVCVCVYVYMYVCVFMYVCVCVCMYLCVCVCMYICMYMYALRTLSNNKVRELATVCLPWQHWTKPLVWFDDVDISAFHSCVVDLWQSLSDWHLLLSACVLVCRRENVGA